MSEGGTRSPLFYIKKRMLAAGQELPSCRHRVSGEQITPRGQALAAPGLEQPALTPRLSAGL